MLLPTQSLIVMIHFIFRYSVFPFILLFCIFYFIQLKNILSQYCFNLPRIPSLNFVKGFSCIVFDDSKSCSESEILCHSSISSFIVRLSFFLTVLFVTFLPEIFLFVFLIHLFNHLALLSVTFMTVTPPFIVLLHYLHFPTSYSVFLLNHGCFCIFF